LKMKKIKQNGFVLVVVIMSIAIIAIEMAVLTGGSNAILFQTNTAYLQACRRNLVASGLAWAEKNIKNGNKQIFDKTVELDIADMNIRRASLSVTVRAPVNKKAEVQINSSVSRGRRTLRHKGKYHINVP